MSPLLVSSHLGRNDLLGLLSWLEMRLMSVRCWGLIWVGMVLLIWEIAFVNFFHHILRPNIIWNFFLLFSIVWWLVVSRTDARRKFQQYFSSWLFPILNRYPFWIMEDLRLFGWPACMNGVKLILPLPISSSVTSSSSITITCSTLSPSGRIVYSSSQDGFLWSIFVDVFYFWFPNWNMMYASWVIE